MTPARITAIGLLVVILAGCALDNSQPEPAPSTPSAPNTTVVEVLWQQDETLMSPYEVDSGVAVAYVADSDGSESVVARDAETGAELWRKPASPGVGSKSNQHEIAILPANAELGRAESLVAFLEPINSSDRWARFMVVTITDGKPVPDLKNLRVLGRRPWVCDESFCLRTKQSQDSQMALHEYFSEAGVLKEIPETPPNAYKLSTHMSLSTKDERWFIHFSAGDTTWERDLDSAFVESELTFRSFQWFDEDQSLPVIGSVSAEHDRTESPNEFTQDLTLTSLTGLDRKTGNTVWKIAGGSNCNPAPILSAIEGILVACRINSGEAIAQWDGTSYTKLEFTNLDIDLIGINPLDGTINWEVGLGADPWNLPLDRGMINVLGERQDIVAEDQVLGELGGGIAIVDRVSGQANLLPADNTFLCNIVRDATQPLSDPSNDGAVSTYARSFNQTACSSSGDPLPVEQLDYRALEFAGFDTDEVTILNLTTGVTAIAPSPESH